MNLPRLSCTVLLCLLAFRVSAQPRSDIDVAKQALLRAPQSPKFDYTSTKESTHLGQKLASGAFFVYKRCISSQDYRHCTFTISCSEYALRSVQQHGILLGTLMGLDRYARCHPIHPNFYPWDEGRQRSVDPVTR